jgi:hypothetical protein
MASLSDAELSADAKTSGCKDIARQLVEFPFGDGLEVALGGGRSYFLPNTANAQQVFSTCAALGGSGWDHSALIKGLEQQRGICWELILIDHTQAGLSAFSPARILRPDGARFEVRGSPRVLSAINTMVPAHAPFLAGETGWSVASEEMEDGVALIVGGDGEQIQGLGFFGLMTIGAHHQEHHLMMAKGAGPHH